MEGQKGGSGAREGAVIWSLAAASGSCCVANGEYCWRLLVGSGRWYQAHFLLSNDTFIGEDTHMAQMVRRTLVSAFLLSL